MIYLGIFLLELLTLYFLTKRLTSSLYKGIHKLTKNKKSAAYIFSIFFLPGTFAHEIAHFLTALFLLVPVGKVNLVPSFKGEGVRMGSVEIGKTDFIRRFVVGIAPLIFGTGIIITTLYYTTSNNLLNNIVYLLLTVYIIFQIGNTMFMSKKDLEGAWVLLVLIIFIYAILYFLGVEIGINTESSFFQTIFDLLRIASYYLIIPIAIDLLLLYLFGLMKK